MTTANHNDGQFFRLESKPSGVKILWLDVPKVNVLKMAVLEELDGILDRLANDPSLEGLVIASAKAGVFIAGADINEIRGLQSQGEEKTYQATMNAKRILAKLRSLGVPSVAAINGACKGGGLELALWCTHRLAANSLEVALAVPEVRLGIFPGFGGCVLLPRLIDTIKAVTMIATGSDVGAQEAWQTGLVDEVVAAEELITRAEAIALGAKSKKAPSASKGKKAPFAERAVAALLDVTEPFKADRFSVMRHMVSATTHGFAGKQVLAQITKRSKGYNAPAQAASLTLRTLTMPLAKALELESAIFSKLVKSTESANLVSIFLDRSRAKKLASGTSPARVTELGVIGSGIMGAEIAFEAICSEQFEKVVVIDIKEEFLAKAKAGIEKLMAGRVKSGKFTAAAAADKLAKLTLSTSYSDLVNCDAIIEAVPEKDEIKFATYKQVDEVMASRSKESPWFLFSNTSARDLEVLKTGVVNDANFSGMHFFNPVSQMAGVEIPGTTSTSEQTMATAISLVSALGKIPLPCKNYPGFIVNAILGPYLAMTAHLLAMGVAPAAIDKAILNFGMPMGPVELMDYVGLDVVASVAKTLSSAHGDRLALPELDLVGKLVEQGFLGRKGSYGFYVWEDGKTVKDVKTRKPVLGAPYRSMAETYNLGNTPMAEEAIVKLLIGTIENEAMRVLEAEVVSDPFLIDLAFVISTGFTASLGGPLRHIDQLGVKTFSDLSRNIASGAEQPGQSWRKNFVPCALLAEHAANRTNIYPA
jgi:3-hydroxyacyl-CoA dehydrogenase/enoyl-CoA hydratase/3-hydroxybutyryl-CoA epimerase